jgi:SAM-dependent methyltransferase
MRWRVEVARRLQTHLGIAPGTRIVAIGRGKRDIDALCEVLPGAIGFRLSDLRVVGGNDLEPRILVPTRRESTKGQAAGDASGASFSGRSLLAEGVLDLVVAWLVMTRLPTARRRRLLEEIRRALRVGGRLCVVDHNQPRTWWQWLGNAGWCLLRGVEPYARPAYPVAREVKDAGFKQISLRVAFRERVQIVCGMRAPGASEIEGTHDAGNETWAQ